MTHLAQLPQRALVHQLVLPGEVPAPLLVGLHRGVGLPLLHSPEGWRSSSVGQGSGCALLSSLVHRGSLQGWMQGEGGAFKPSLQQERAWHKQWPWKALMCYEQKPFGVSLPARTPAGSNAGGQALLQGEGKPLSSSASDCLCSRPNLQRGCCSARGPFPRSGKGKQPKVTSRR